LVPSAKATALAGPAPKHPANPNTPPRDLPQVQLSPPVFTLAKQPQLLAPRRLVRPQAPPAFPFRPPPTSACSPMHPLKDIALPLPSAPSPCLYLPATISTRTTSATLSSCTHRPTPQSALPTEATQAPSHKAARMPVIPSIARASTHMPKAARVTPLAVGRTHTPRRQLSARTSRVIVTMRTRG
jgi:hypothetical protein